MTYIYLQGAFIEGSEGFYGIDDHHKSSNYGVMPENRGGYGVATEYGHGGHSSPPKCSWRLK